MYTVTVLKNTLVEKRALSSPQIEETGQQLARRLLLHIVLLIRKHVPESERFVTGTGHDRLPIRRNSQIEHPERVPSEHRNSLHARVVPDYYLVQGVAVRGDDFVAVFGEK